MDINEKKEVGDKMLRLNIQQFGGRGASSSNSASSKTSNAKKKAGYLVINEMIDEDFKKLKEQIAKYREENSKTFHNWYDFRRDEHPEMSEEEFREEKKKRYNAHMSFQYDNRGMANLSGKSDESLRKGIVRHYDDLQAKVEKKIGKIKYITKTGNNGYDYRMENAKGESVSVEVIGAGGYNIQRYHTRWIIKK